jgi:hypothetical protein
MLPKQANSRTDDTMAKPRLVKRADGEILQLGEGSDFTAAEMISVMPAIILAKRPSVSPAMICAKIRVPN